MKLVTYLALTLKMETDLVNIDLEKILYYLSYVLNRPLFECQHKSGSSRSKFQPCHF